MGNLSIINDIIEDKLMGLHTAYVAKVLSYRDGRASIQPLTMVKQYGNTAKKPSILTSVPVLSCARYKLIPKQENDELEATDITFKSLAEGDIVFCVCAERNISEAKKGNMAVPPIGHHSMSDSVIVGVL